MRRFPTTLMLVAGFCACAWSAQEPPPAASTATLSDYQESEQSASSDEGEAKGIIPPSGDVTVSTQPITPVTTFPEKQAYEQAKDELQRALGLWKNGDVEAASDTALEAYDDLESIHYRRRKQRTKLYAQRRQAATVYVQAGIAYIRNYVQKAGDTTISRDEGRSRLEDLRDVSKNYPELNKILSKAIEQLTPPTIPTVPVASTSTLKTTK